ncbi:SDR family NAD(P)-dependent oxidoreductase [Undibacterium oligocarboniphilum]|uniref:SDR family oxidoreductase n=1 Tax=Undibacterium oligocarboniphilum TaxID=666702 RepID=A0A850QR38_9BURK|nr:SDR family oxidoreductase [Undibacterium oligocarboniphilum]MBC3871179.1 SDR family oxidoreductase [Undibacterium oligocarboniphilum]NVO79270.1 SDR family oxidoreductase [Undibacterium oligocarboniphilum]
MKKMIITGGASGIGLATAERCLQEGASVAIADLPGPTAEQVVAGLNARYSGPCFFMSTHVSSTEQADRLTVDTVSAFGRLDGVFNNAGISG